MNNNLTFTIIQKEFGIGWFLQKLTNLMNFDQGYEQNIDSFKCSGLFVGLTE